MQIETIDIIRAVIAAQDGAYEASSDEEEFFFDVRFYEFDIDPVRAVEHEHEDGGYVLISRVDPHGDIKAMAAAAMAEYTERRELERARA